MSLPQHPFDALSRQGADLLDTALDAIRRHFGMEVAYLSEFVGDETAFRAVAAPGLEALIKPGDRRSSSEVYCRHILEGRLPRLIRDTADEPLAASMPITSAVPIGSHVAVPVRRPDGSAFGMLCCLSRQPNPSLASHDVEVLALLVALSSERLSAALAERSRLDAVIRATRVAMAEGGFVIAFQPIRDLLSLAPRGVEALCRFRARPYRSPDRWFAEAGQVGLDVELESAAASLALDALDRLPGSMFVSINASPATLAAGEIGRIVAGRDLARIVVEVTEHECASPSDYAEIARQLEPLRRAGLSLAVDDVGAGHAGLQRILRLRPDTIKLDMSLTRNVHRDHAHAALARALAGFAGQTGAKLVAEGIETKSELVALRALGVVQGQGYLLGRPAPIESLRPSLTAASTTSGSTGVP